MTAAPPRQWRRYNNSPSSTDARATGERIALALADARTCLDAVGALLALDLTVAAKFIIKNPHEEWPSLAVAREWQMSKRQRRSVFDGGDALKSFAPAQRAPLKAAQ